MDFVQMLTFAAVLWATGHLFVLKMGDWAIVGLRHMGRRNTPGPHYFARDLVAIARVDPTFVARLGLPRRVHKWPRSARFQR